MSNQGKKNIYKPSKELLEDLMTYASVKAIAEMIGINEKTLNGYCKVLGINSVGFIAKRGGYKSKPIPGELLDRLQAEREEFLTRDVKLLKLDEDECLTVPDEVFREPEPVEEVPELPGINTHDIKAFINSGSVMDYLYMRQPKQRQDFYGGYIGTANRRNAKGASDRNFHAVCGKKIMNMKGKGGNPQYPTCGEPECRKIANRMRARDAKKIKQRINIAGIAQMKKDLDTKEKFLKATYGHNKSKAVAREYGITDKDLAEQRETLFAGMKPAEIRELRKKVTAPVFVGNGSEVKVYKIIDKEALEKEIREHKFGEPVSYDHLEFDRIEYGKPFSMPFNAALEMEECL